MPGITQKQQQVQKLSVRTIQNLKILEMTSLELKDFIEKEALENPVIELDQMAQAESAVPDYLQRLESAYSSYDYQNRYYDKDDRNNNDEPAVPFYHNGLKEYLHSQVLGLNLSDTLQIAMDCVISELDDNGYLQEEPEILAKIYNQSVSAVINAERIIKQMDPPGIAARSLSECLELQLEQLGISGLTVEIVRNHLEDLSQGHFHQIAKITGATREEIQVAYRQICSLNPKPGAFFSTPEASDYMYPDLIVRKSDNDFMVELLDDKMPVIRTSPYYKGLLESTSDPNVKQYLEDRFRRSAWMIDGISRRKQTLLNCAQLIVDRQRAFFEKGPGHLLPLTQAAASEVLGMHESTISRAVKGKTLQCKFGVFPLSYFFNSSLSDQEGMTSDYVKSRIQSFIKAEDKRHPLSDQKLCDLLLKEDIEISRRTVAKYRDEMQIPATTARKQF